MTTVASRKLKPAARAVLEAAARHHEKKTAPYPPTWFKPREIGGTATNRYGSHLKQLVTRGLIERRDGAPNGWRECTLWEYRITETGLEELRGDASF